MTALPIFHDYDIRVTNSGREIFKLTGLPEGHYCVIKLDTRNGMWRRKTCNGCKPSIRYEWYLTEQQALDAGQAWARRKDAERAREAKAAEQLAERKAREWAAGLMAYKR